MSAFEPPSEIVDEEAEIAASVKHLRSVRDASWVVANEFASVWVSVDLRGNSPRLLVQTPDNDHIYLDPLELACLTRWPHEDLAHLLRTDEYQ